MGWFYSPGGLFARAGNRKIVKKLLLIQRFQDPRGLDRILWGRGGRARILWVHRSEVSGCRTSGPGSSTADARAQNSDLSCRTSGVAHQGARGKAKCAGKLSGAPSRRFRVTRPEGFPHARHARASPGQSTRSSGIVHRNVLRRATHSHGTPEMHSRNSGRAPRN